MSSLIDITVGRYQHRDSPVHRLDPRAKLAALAFLIISVFLAGTPWSFSIVTLFLVAAISLSRLSVRLILRSLRPMIWLLVSVIMLHFLFSPDGTGPLFSLGPIRANWYGVYAGIDAACRFLLIIVGAVVLSLTTMPLRLADGMTRALNPLRKIGLPMHQFPVMLVIALNFIPELFSDGEKLISAQRARGSQQGQRGFFRKIRSMIPILVSLLRISFRRADELAAAMESRCYSGESRTNLHDLAFSTSDAVALIAAGAMIPLTLAVNSIPALL